MKRLCFALLAALAFSQGAEAQLARKVDILLLELSTGERVEISLFPQDAPRNVARIEQLARSGFYNNVIFHRVIKGFLAQTGDPTGLGTGGSNLPDVVDELSSDEFVYGTVAMANLGPNTANSQFFICSSCSFLSGHYSPVGKVTKGMEYIERLPPGEPPSNPTRILRATVTTRWQ
ncbi:MAG: peptidylprolyl isomerase [Hyphomonadaceae bacterium]